MREGKEQGSTFLLGQPHQVSAHGKQGMLDSKRASCYEQGSWKDPACLYSINGCLFHHLGKFAVFMSWTQGEFTVDSNSGLEKA